MKQRPSSAPSCERNFFRFAAKECRMIRQQKTKKKSNSGDIDKYEDALTYLKERVEPILSPAITYILNGNTLEENDIPELFLDYFEKCQGVATTDEWKRQQVLIAKRTPRSRVQVIRATAKIASSISTMILSLLQFRPETNIVQFLIDSMQKRPQEKENKHTSNFNTLGGLQNAKRSCLLDNPACSRTSALVGKAVATQKLIFLIIGLENSGKSTLVSVLKGQFNPNCRPSLGFRPVSLKYDDMTTIKLYDVGGGKNIRGIWNNYFHEVHGVVFVVDSACPDETLEDTVQVANSTLGHKYLQGKPLLIISNKVDKCDSRSEIVISNTLSIPIPSDGGSSKIFETSLHPKHAGYKGKPDPQIDNNMDWLIQKVISSMDDLNERMTEDIKEVKQKRLKLQEEKERKIFKTSLCKAFALNGQTYSDVLVKEEAEDFLAHELKLSNRHFLPLQGEIVCSDVGYQRFALMLVGKMINNTNGHRSKTWDEVLLYIQSIRYELGLDKQK